MTLYACRDCGATDGFETSTMSRAVNWKLRIDALSTEPRIRFRCDVCGRETVDMDELVQPVLLDGATHDQSRGTAVMAPELLDALRHLVAILAVGYAHEAYTIVDAVVSMLGEELDIDAGYAEAIHESMRSEALIECAAADDCPAIDCAA